MKDLDFEELDRAVNSLVSQAKDGGAASAAADRSEPSKTPAQAERAAAQSDIVAVASKPAQSATTPSVTPPTRTRLGAKRPSNAPSRGNFIDIVAPKSSGPAPKVSRTGSMVQPVSKPEALRTEPQTEALAAKPEALKPENTLEEPLDEVAIEPSEVSEPAKAKQSSGESWPDPLDFHDEDKADDDKVVVEAAKSAEEPQDKTPKWQQNDAGSSPFLPGAKVEKRPLGAFAPAEEPPATTPKQETPAPEQAVESNAASEMPDELKPEVLAAESNQLVDRSLDESKPEKSTPEEEETEEPELSQVPEPKVEQQVRESALQSIQQQYKTPTKQVSDAPRPVFDTKEYHPPLLEATAHSAHRGNPLARLFIALLVVAVLAVGGYFAFLYVTQN